MTSCVTRGIDHVGLTVSSLDKSVDFFVNALGWRVVGGNPDYPAVYVGDGHLVVTLWQVGDTKNYAAFDRQQNVGLHHLALAIPSSDELDALFDKIQNWGDLHVEFSPEYSGIGPKRHFMVLEPGGNRLEFSWDPRRS